jgi:class 3 adenylate cyclase/predicted ATPase
MFCDLVGSTPLTEQLDLEDLREVMQAYQQVCAKVVQHFDGHIAQLLGDALLVYFGWPQAHEDDAQRAVRAGLGMLDAMGTLNTRLERDKGVRLAIRVSIHTGWVVVGKMDAGEHQEQLALGNTPNLASRLLGLAEPDTMVISEVTYRLIEGYFMCRGLGAPMLKGVSQPMPVYRVLEESGAQSRLDVALIRGLTPLVGREQEVALLRQRWEQVKDGHGQVILLKGEAGIGKSRLVQELKDHVAGEPHTQLECRSSPYYQNTALYPITDLLRRILQWQQDDTSDTKLRKLETIFAQSRLAAEASVPLMAALLSLPLPENLYPPLTLTPRRQRQQTLETIVALLVEQAAHHPLLFILEDLHWTDPTTLEFLDLLIDRMPTAALCMVLSYRPTFQPTWRHRAYLTAVTVNRLRDAQIEQIVERFTAGTRLPPALLQEIVDKAEGVPLYAEEIIKAVLETGFLTQVNGQYQLVRSLSSFAIPPTLQDSLMARLDRLVTAKGVAQLGAVIGRQFTYELLQAVSSLDKSTLQRELERLVEAELVYQRGFPLQATYTFKHTLIRDAAYESLLKSTRQQYHQRIAQVLKEQFAETTEAQPEVLAHHYTEAGLNEQAIACWQQAGQHALDHSAYVEAIAHLTRGLEVLQTLPNTSEHRQQELTLRVALGAALLATKGHAASEVKDVYDRARELCRQVGETPHLFPVLFGLWRFYFGRAEWPSTHELGAQLLALAQHLQKPVVLVAAHYALGTTLLYLGQVVPARLHLEQGSVLYDPQQHGSSPIAQEAGASCLSWVAMALWTLGYPDQALEKGYEALGQAHNLSQPFSLARALLIVALLHHSRRETQAAQEKAEAAMALCTQQGFTFYLAMWTILQGWALSEQGRGEEGIAQIRQGLADWESTGARMNRPYFLALLAEAYGKAGCTEEGLRILAESLALVERTGERRWEADIYRLKGELLLQANTSQERLEGEAHLRQAIDIARHQQAKSLELRATVRLCRLWQQEGKIDAAYQLLIALYGWFTEGFDTVELKESKLLLQTLTG